MQSNYLVYILECNDKSFYIGKTVDILKRIKAHNGIIAGGAKYTRGRRPVFLVYYEKYKSAGEALAREYELKQLTRVQKVALIANGVRIE
jgi:putative endonuclease